MRGSAEGSAAYLAQELRNAFATDSRVHELGLEVTVLGETIVLRGTVSTPALRDAASQVASELAPEAEILNDIEIPPNPEPESAEELD